MADNKIGLEKMFKLCEQLKLGELSFVEFLEKADKIVFNDMGSNALTFFSDGWREGTASNFYRLCLKAYDGDDTAYQRLLVDLGIKDVDLVIKVINK